MEIRSSGRQPGEITTKVNPVQGCRQVMEEMHYSGACTGPDYPRYLSNRHSFMQNTHEFRQKLNFTVGGKRT